MKKNTQRQILFVMKDTAGAGVTGLTTTCQVGKDGGAFAGCSNSPAEISNGWYKITLTATELNADAVAFKATGSGAIQFDQVIYPDVNTPEDVYGRVGAPAGASVSADVAAVKSDTAAGLTRLPAALVGGRMDANVGAISGDATAADNLEAATDGTGYNVGNGSVVAASVTGAVGSVTGAVGSVGANGINAASLDPDVTTELQNGLATAAALSTVAGYIDTEVAAILADTNELQTDWVNGGRLDLLVDAILARLPAALVGGRMDASVGAVAANAITAAGIDPDVTTELQNGLATASALATVDGIVDDILVDTAVIGAAGAGLTALASQASVTAVKAKTDLIPASPAAVGSAMTLDFTQTVSDVGGAMNTLGGIMSGLRALVNGKMTIVSGVLKLFGQNGTTQIGVDRTISGTVPTDTTRQ